MVKIEPRPKLDASINIRTTKGVKQEVEKIAKENNVSVNNLVNHIIKIYILQNDR